MPIGGKDFPVRRLLDEDGEDLEDFTDQKRFCEARNGDHLMTPFQCDLCHFRNIYKRDPSPRKATDNEALEFFRRASLDAFWSRAASTVKGNLGEAKRSQRFCDRMGLPCLIPEMGPFPLEDTMGMLSAAAILDRSLDRGVTERYVQWDTFRGARSLVTNATQAGISGLGDSVGAYEKNRMWISGVVTHSFWFSRFMTGLHRRVGEVKRQDEPLTIDVLHALEGLMEAEWQQPLPPETRRHLAEMGVWFIAGFCSGLRGEEMLLIEFAGTRHSLSFLQNEVCPHFLLSFRGGLRETNLGEPSLGSP